MTSLKYLLLLLFFTIDLVIGVPPFTKEQRLKVNVIMKRVIQEVEKSGMRERGLYTIDGDVLEMKKLAKESLNPFKDISPYDIHVMTFCLKAVIGNLQPSLIDEATFNQLSDALEIENSEELKDKMKEILYDLPQEIRYTLAYLMRHLKKVVKLQEINGMTPKIIANAFRLSLMHFKPDEQRMRDIDPKKIKIIKKLLEIPSSFYKELKNPESVFYFLAPEDIESASEISDEEQEGASVTAGPLDSNEPSGMTKYTNLKRLIEAVEKIGIKQKGLYSDDDESNEMATLPKDCLVSNTDISQYDVRAMALCLQRELRRLNPSLIDRATFKKLLVAARLKNLKELENEMSKILSELPQDIRNTLAYLIIHLKKVVKLHAVNKMTEKKIASIFSLILMHYAGEERLLADADREKIIRIFLRIPSSYWKTLINYESTNNESTNLGEEEGAWGGAPREEFSASNEQPSMTQYTNLKRLIEAVEETGMKQKGLYSDDDKSIKRINLPTDCLDPTTDISQYDVRVMTLCLQRELRRMEPSLIDRATFSKLKVLLNFQKLSQWEYEISKILSKLPQDIRNTLAYLIIHLKKVVKLQEINKMTEEKIASIFSLILMRYPGEESLLVHTDREKIIRIFLRIPSSYWKAFINYESTAPEDLLNLNTDEAINRLSDSGRSSKKKATIQYNTF
ncbi:uncharacterized protein LOC122503304 [Leptopilina heterotoma]|uniref:uncharacterized protein LOC122503304 n=1 Tax=Leptopilina heterotoma TaxID=63436 RepID=UPI001CA87B93|nr:uncharacterized protein LOC122503304 [Leptopilina heterotoma]